MDDDIKKQIDRALADKKARDAAAQQAREDRAALKSKSIDSYRKKLAAEFVPALEEIAMYMRSKDVEATVIVDNGLPPIAKLEIGKTRPSSLNIQFDPDTGMVNFLKVVQNSAANTSGSDGNGHLDLITKELIHKKALNLFQQALK